MRAFFVFVAMTIAFPALSQDRQWFVMNQNSSNAVRFLRCEMQGASPAEMFEHVKQYDNGPSISDLADGSVQLTYWKGLNKFTLLYYRTLSACESAATTARSAAEAEKRKLDPYR